MKKVTYKYAKEQKQNPYIGFTSFQHYRDDALYSDLVVRPENNMTETEHVECYPVPEYVEENGREQGYYPDCSVVYIRILWKEFEPEEGKYNYGFIEDILRKAKENAQTVMFRIMQHSTRESDDVPDWLKEKIECPTRPDGMRVKDCPSDPEFLQYFGKAIRAFGEKFDGDASLAMVDISLPGAWGEGSHIELFTEEQLKSFVDIYTDVFKNTLLIGQVCAPWLVEYSNQKRKIGWRADCIGPEDSYKRILPWVEEMSDVWKKGHVSFESYWWLGEWKRKDWDIDTIIQRLLDWHVSTFNAKSLPIPFEWKNKIEDLVSKMGYHYIIREVECDCSVGVNEKLNVLLNIENIGVAPIYFALPLYIKLKKGHDERIFNVDIDIRNWLPGTNIEKIEFIIPCDMDEGEYELQIGIGGNDVPNVCFATDAKQDGDFSVLTNVMVEK